MTEQTDQTPAEDTGLLSLRWLRPAFDPMTDAFRALPAPGYRSISVTATSPEGTLVTLTLSCGSPDEEDALLEDEDGAPFPDDVQQAFRLAMASR